MEEWTLHDHFERPSNHCCRTTSLESISSLWSSNNKAKPKKELQVKYSVPKQEQYRTLDRNSVAAERISPSSGERDQGKIDDRRSEERDAEPLLSTSIRGP